MRKAALHNLGCKVNSYETEAMKELLQAAGYEIVDFEDKADVYVINTCSVTNVADKKSRQMLHRARTRNPQAVVVAAGCYVQAAGEKLKEDGSVDLIVGNNKKTELVSLLEEYFAGREHPDGVIDISAVQEYEPLHITAQTEHTRAFIKVQDGCNQFCSYCIIPYTRGRIRSRRMEDVEEEVRGLAKKGYQEVVLTGIHLSSYGLDFKDGTDLLALIRRIHQVDGIKRIRFGSLEPRIITDEFAKALSELPKVCPHFHLSLQSGCDDVLKRMNRHYDTAFYRDLVARIRTKFDNPSITTDIMVGFPGETEEEFAESLAFAKEIGFGKVHVFAYSIRPGTRAAKMPNQLTNHQKEQRSHKMAEVTEQSRQEFLQSQVGKIESVLFETQQADGMQHGYTKNYTPVCVKSDRELCGEIHDVRITGVQGDLCTAELV